MLRRNLTARAERQFVRDTITVYLFEHMPNGRIAILSNVEFTEVPPEEAVEIGVDGINLSRQTAQELMDSLWDCGLRPSEGSGSAGALAATERHLKDVQDFSRRLLSLVEKNH